MSNAFPIPQLGDGIYSQCYTSPITYAIQNKNPYDITNWAYVYNTDDAWVEDLTQCDGSVCTGNPPNADRYLGVISQVCDSSPTIPVSDYDGIEYITVMADNAANTCVQSSSNNYGVCDPYDPIGNKSHYWFMRDWGNTMNYWDSYNGGSGSDGKVYCCTYPSNPSDVPSDYPQRTVKCPTTYWPGSPLCIDVMAYSPTTQKGYCDYEKWTSDDTGYCDLYMNSDEVCQTNKNQVLTGALTQWIQEKLDGGTKKPSEKDPFIPKILKYASEQPGVFDNYISQACSTVKLKDLKKNPNLAKLCGCFLPATEYLRPGIIPVECQISCALNSQVGGLSRGEWNNTTQQYDALQCNQTTCVMDDVTIDLINSNYGSNGIDLSQLCSGCSTSEGDRACTCLMNGTTVNSVNSKISGGVTIDQLCKGCSSFSNSSATTGTSVSCNTGNPISYGGGTAGGCDVDLVKEGLHEIEGDIATNVHLFWVIGGLLIAIIVLFVIWLYFKSKNNALKRELR